MSRIELIMPKMGESVAEATIIKWVKNIGDNIELDETIVEIATDKVDSEIPSISKGILKEKLYNENDVVKVGEVIAIIEDGEKEENNKVSGEQITPKEKSEKVLKNPITTEEKKHPIKINSNSDTQQNTSNRFYSPLVKNIAKKENISIAELDKIEGSGKNGRLTKSDLFNYIQTKSTKTSNQTEINISKSIDASKSEINTPIPTGEVEIIEMDRMRKLIAKHMIQSKSISAHVTSFVEADVSKIVEWRNRIKNKFLQREQQKITYTPIIFESVIRAIIDFPLINISVDGDNIIKHKNINLGMATALSNGNLIVPVIKRAQEKNILGLTKAVNDLAKRARENQLKPDEVTEGTFTVTNVGSFGSVMGTPIINQPQVAILALGKIQKKPTVIETEFGDSIGIRSKMFLSLSYDHRVVDGALGGRFLQRIADYLESFDINKEI
jgi:2-oxoglutarate dehydrogenase E2 component (dihydrolipoamide succinyltransferase)